MDLVKEFMTIGSQKYYISNNDNMISSLVTLRADLINEEINELHTALETNDFVETVDALADIAYVIYGYILILNDKEECDDFIKNNDPFYNPVNKYFSNEETKKDMSLINLKHYVNYLDEEHNKFNEINNILLDAINKKLIYNINDKVNNNWVLIKANLFNILDKLLYKTYLLASIINVDLNKAFTAVHTSNMSKFDKNIKDAQKTMDKYKTEGKETYCDILNHGSIDYFITKAKNGKILKSHNYKSPDFSYL